MELCHPTSGQLVLFHPYKWSDGPLLLTGDVAHVALPTIFLPRKAIRSSATSPAACWWNRRGNKQRPLRLGFGDGSMVGLFGQ